MKRFGFYFFLILLIITSSATSVFAVARVAHYTDAAFTDTQTTFTQGQTVYSRILDNFDAANYYGAWRDPANSLIQRQAAVYQGGPSSDSYTLGLAATLGAWETSFLHNPNFDDWMYIEFISPTSGNLPNGTDITFSFKIYNRDGNLITSDNTANLELFLRQKNTTYENWTAASAWSQGGDFTFDAGTYSCTWTAENPNSKGGRFGARYAAAGGAESGDAYAIRVENTIAFNVGSAPGDPCKFDFLPYNGPDISNYPAHSRFDSTGNPIRVKWVQYLGDYTSNDTTVAPACEITLTESNDYNPAAGQDNVMTTTYLAEANNVYADLDMSSFNSGKYAVAVEYVGNPSSNLYPRNVVNIFLDQYSNFTVQSPPSITADTYTLRRTDHTSYPNDRATRGQTVAWEIRVYNSGQAGLEKLAAGSSYLTFDDGTGNVYKAYLAASSDSLCSQGSYCWLTFSSASIPDTFVPQVVSNLQLVLNGTDTNGMSFPNSGSNYTVNVNDTVTVQYAPDLRYVSGLTQTTRGTVDSPYRYVTQGETNLVLTLKLTNFATGGNASLTAGDTITTSDTISFTDGTRTYTGRLSSAVNISANETVTLTFDALSGDTVDGSFTAGAYNIDITLQDSDDNGFTYNDDDLDDIGTHQLTVQAPPDITYSGSLTKLFPAPSATNVSQGTNVQFKLELANDGSVDLPFDNSTSINIGDGTDTYTAAVTAEDTISSGGGTKQLTFALTALSSAIDTGPYCPQVTISGEDRNGRPYFATVIVNDSVTVKSPPTLSYESSLDPISASQGETGVAISLIARNTGEAGITLTTGDTIEFGDGTDTFSANLSAGATLNGNGTAALTFSSATVPAALDAGSYNPKILFSDTDAYGYYISSSFTVGDNLTVTEPAALNAGSVNAMPSEVSKGQSDILALEITFADTTAGSGGVKLDSFKLNFYQDGGNTLDISEVLDAVTIKHADGSSTPTLQAFGSPSGSQLTVTMGGAQYWAAGENFTVQVLLDIAAGAGSDSTIAVRLDSAGNITAYDSVSGTSLSATGAFALSSETATIKAQAALSLANVSAMPTQVSQGRDVIKSQSLTFSCASGGGAAKLSSFLLSFYNDGTPGSAIAMIGVADSVTVATGAAGETYTFVLEADDTQVLVDFGGTPQYIAAGGNQKYNVYFNVWDTATANTKFRTQITTAGDITASDSTSGTGINVTGSFAAKSDVATVVNAAECNVVAFDSMPATVDPGQTLVRAMQVRFSNDIAEPGASSNISGFWLTFRDTDDNALDVYELVSSVSIKDAEDEETLYDEVDITSGCTDIYIDFSISAPGSVVPTPPPLLIDVYLNIHANAGEDSTIKTVLADTDAVTVANANSGEALEAFATNGWATVASSPTRVNALVPSLNTFSDTDLLIGSATFSTDQRAYVKAIGLTANDTHGIHWYNTSGSVVQSETYVTNASGWITSDSYDIPTGGPAGTDWEVRVYRESGFELKDTAGFTVQNKAAVTVSTTNQMPTTVIEGQTNVDALDISFANSATAPASQLKLLSFYLDFQDTDSNALDINDIVSAVKVYDGATLRHEASVSSSCTQVYVNFSTDDPDLINAGASCDLTVKLDFAADADSNTVKCLISDSAMITVRDENSGDSTGVPKNASPDWNSLSSDPAAIQNEAQLSTTLLTNDMPDSVTRGQTNIDALTFKFENTAAAPARTIKLSQFDLDLPVLDASGNDTDITGLLSSVTITWPTGDQTSFNPSASPITFDFGGPQYIEAGDSLTVSVTLSFSATGYPGYRISTRIADNSDITASDSTSGAALSSGGSFPMASDTAAIDSGASLLTELTDFLPATVAQGQSYVKAARFTFNNNGDSTAAGARLYNAVVKFKDSLGDAQNVNGLLDNLKYSFGVPGADTETVSFSSDTTQVSLVIPASYRTIYPGDTVTVTCILAFAADAAPNSTLKLAISLASDIRAEDNNYAEGSGSISSGGDFDMKTAYVTVEDSASLSLSQTSSMPATVSQGQQLVESQQITFTAVGATVQNNSFAIAFKDGANGDVNAYGLVDQVYVYNGSETLTAGIASNPTYSVTITDTSSARYIDVGSPITFKVYLDINSNATENTVFRTQITDGSAIDAYDSNTQQSVTYKTFAATPLNGESTTVQTKASLSVAVADEMPASSVQGQRGIPAAIWTFTADNSSAPQAGVELYSVWFDFTDNSGGTERDISTLADTITFNIIRGADNDTYTVAAGGYDTDIQVDLTSATFGGSYRELDAGDTLSIRMLLDITSDATAGTTLRAQITSATLVNGNDSNTDVALAGGQKSLSASPLPSGATTIKNDATLSVTGSDNMPGNMSLGQSGEKVQEFTFTNGAGAPGADLTLTSFVLTVADGAGADTNAIDAISEVVIRDAGTGDTWGYTIDTSAQTVMFGGPPLTIGAASSKTFEVYLDIFDTGYAGKTFRVEISDAGDIAASDAISEEDVTATGSFPENSGTTTLQGAADLYAAATTSPSATYLSDTVQQGTANIRLASYHFSNQATSGSASGKLYDFVLYFKDEAGDTLNIYNVLDNVKIKNEDGSSTGTLQTETISGLTQFIVVDFDGEGNAQTLAPGETLTLGVYADVNMSAAVGTTLKCQLSDTQQIDFRDINTGDAATAEMSVGGALPLASDTTKIAAAIPTVEAYSDAARADVQDAYSIGQTVYTKYWGLSGLTNYDCRWEDADDTSYGAFVQTNTIQTGSGGIINSDSRALAAGDAAGTWTIKVYTEGGGSYQDHKNITVENAAGLNTSQVSSMPGQVVQGQSTVYVQTISIADTAATPYGARAKLNYFTLWLYDENDNPLNLKSYLDWIKINDGSSTYTFNSIDWGASQKNIGVDFDGVPQYINAQDTAAYTVVIAIADDAPAGNTLKCLINTASEIAATDENSGDSITSNGSFAIESDTTRIVSEAELTVVSTNHMPSAVSQTQQNVRAQQFSFFNDATAPASDAKLSGFVLSFADQNGSDTDLSYTADTIVIVTTEGGTPDTVTIDAAGDTSSLSVDYTAATFGGAARYLAQGETMYVDVWLSFLSNAPAGARLQTQIDDGSASNFTLEDSATGNAVTAGGFGGGALNSTAVTVKALASISLTQDTAMPEESAQGADSVTATTLHFQSDATPSANAAGVKLYSFTLDFQDSAGSAITINDVAENVYIRNATTLAVLQSFPGEASSSITVDFGGSPQTITVGDTLKLEVIIDIHDTAAEGSSIKVLLSDTATMDARDENIDSADDTLTASSDPALPLDSHHTTILGKAALEVNMTTPATDKTAVLGEVQVEAQTINFAAAAGRTNAQLNSFWLEFQNGSGAELDVEDIIASIAIEYDGTWETYPAAPPFTSGDTAVLINFGGTPQVIVSGETLSVTIYLNISSDAGAPGNVVRTAVTAAARIDAEDTSSSNAVTATASPDFSSITGDSVAIVYKPRLNLTGTDQLDPYVSRGQANAYAQRLSFYNNAGGTPGRAVKLSGFTLRFQDAAGDTDIASYAETVSIVIGSDTYGYTPSGSSLTVDFTADSPIGGSTTNRYIGAEETLHCDVYLDIKAGAPIGGQFKTLLQQLTDITCSDSTTGTAIPYGDLSGDTPVASSLTTVQNGAALDIDDDATVQMPSPVSQGEADIYAHRFIFGNSASAPAASVQLESFKIYFQDENNTDTDVLNVVSNVTVKHGINTLLNQGISVPTTDLAVSIPADDQYLANGDTYDIAIYLSFFDTAFVGSQIKTVIKQTGTDITAYDTNSHGLLTSFGGEANVESSQTALLNDKAFLRINSADHMPDTLAQGTSDQLVLTLWMQNESDSSLASYGAPLRLEQVVLDCVDTSGNPRTVDQLLSTIYVKNELTDVTLQTINNPTGAAQTFNLGGAKIITAGDSISLGFYISVKNAATAGLTLLLRLAENADVTARDNNFYTHGNTADSITANGDFWLQSDTAEIVSAVGSIQTYKNEARTQSATTFSRGQTAYFKAWGLFDNYSYASVWDAPGSWDTKTVDPDQSDGVGVIQNSDDSYTLTAESPTGDWTVRVMDGGDTKASIGFTVQHPATLSTSSAGYGDTLLKRGQQDYLVQSVTFADTADSPGASVIVDSFVLTFRNDDNSGDKNIHGLINGIVIKNQEGGGVLQTIASGAITDPTSSVTIDFGGSPQTIARGDTFGVDIYIDMGSSATPQTTARGCILSASDVYARDYNSSDYVTSSGAFALLSDSITVQYCDTYASTVTADPISLEGDGDASSTITVTLVDPNGAPVEGYTVTLTSSRWNLDNIVQPGFATNSSGVCTGTVSSSDTGLAGFYAYVATIGDTLIDTAGITFTAPINATLSTCTAVSSPLRAGAHNTVFSGVVWNPGDSITGFIIYNGGSATNTDVTELKLYLDNNGDSIYDSADSWVGTLGWNAGGYYEFGGSRWMTVDINGSGGTRSDSFPFVVTAVLGDTASVTDGRTFQAWLDGPNSGIKVDTGPTWIPGYADTNGASQVINTELRLTELNLSRTDTANVVTGAADQTVLSFTIPDDGGGTWTLKDIRLVHSGTLTPSTEYDVSLWRDIDGDSAFEPAGDDAAGEYALVWDGVNGWWEDSGGDLNVAIPGWGPYRWFVSVNIDVDADSGDDLQLLLPGTAAYSDSAFTLDPNINEMDGEALSYTFTVVSRNITINEVYYNPGTGVNAALSEWFELANISSDTVDLAGWEVSASGSPKLTIPADYAKIPPYGYCAIARDTSSSGFRQAGLEYAAGDIVLVQYTGLSLDDNSGTIAIDDNTSQLVDALTYDDAWGADGDSYTLQKNDPTATTNASANWSGSGLIRGTPGHANSNALGSSFLSATGAVADGTDTAYIVATLLTPNNSPVRNHEVTIYVISGDITVTAETGITNFAGQYTTTCTASAAVEAVVGFACTAEDSIALDDTATLTFFADGGWNILGGDTYSATVSSVNTLAGPTGGTSTAYSGTYAMVFANWNRDGSGLSMLEGDFTTVKGHPSTGMSSRNIYAVDPVSGVKTQISSPVMGPCPYGNATIADIDGDGNNEAVFAGYVTCYASPFWGIWMVEADGSDAGVTTADYEKYHISPELNFADAWTPDAIDHGDGIATAVAGYNYNVAYSADGDIGIFSGKKMAESSYTYFSRSKPNLYHARVLRGYHSYRYADGSAYNPAGGVANAERYAYYWQDPTWDPTGTHLAMTRVDLRNLADGGATIFQSEIWVMLNVASRLSGDTDSRGPYMVRVSDATIDGTLPTDADANPGGGTSSDTFYMNPQWGRDGKIISYTYDRSGNFDCLAYMSDPNGAMNNCNFDVAMKYVGSFVDGTDMAAIGGNPANGYYITWPEQIVMAGDANELSLGWSPSGTAQIAGIHWDDATAELRTYDLQSEAYVGENGGVLFDDGMVTAVVPAGDTLASGTVIRVSDPTADPGTDYDTMVATGEAREFWPDGWTSNDPTKVILHYDADDLANAGITDGSAEEAALKVFWWDHVSDEWVDYGGVVNIDENTITFFTTHFSQYGIFAQKNPVSQNSSLTIDKNIALADGTDGALITATVRNAAGNPMPNLPVKLESTRGDSDQFVYSSPVTDGNGQLTVSVRSIVAGTTVISCQNLKAIFPETFTVEFQALPSDPWSGTGSLGLIADTATPGVSLYIPATAFDTAVTFSISLGPGTGPVEALFSQANQRSRAGDGAALVDTDAGVPGAVVAEFHAYRASDGADMDTGFSGNARVIFDIPNGLAWDARNNLVVLLLDERDDDGDGITGEWLELPTIVDLDAGQAWAEVKHFSIYRLGVSSVDVPGLNDVIIYPNPWRADRHAGNANPGVKILLPVNRTFEIKIITIAGQLVDAQQVSTAGGVNSFTYVWDLNNAHGLRVASGVYFIVIRDTASGETTIKKAAVIQ